MEISKKGEENFNIEYAFQARGMTKSDTWAAGTYQVSQGTESVKFFSTQEFAAVAELDSDVRGDKFVETYGFKNMGSEVVMDSVLTELGKKQILMRACHTVFQKL